MKSKLFIYVVSSLFLLGATGCDWGREEPFEENGRERENGMFEENGGRRDDDMFEQERRGPDTGRQQDTGTYR